MKPPHDPEDQSFNNIPELISHLWGLYYTMTLDPALDSFTERLREAVLELEKIRRTAWEVCKQESETSAMPARKSSKKTRKKKTDGSAEWLKSVRPASPLKQ